MLLPTAAAILTVALGQATTGSPNPGGPATDSAPEPPVAAPATGPASGTSNDVTGPGGIPFMPAVGRPPVEYRGLFLDAGLVSQVRARSLTLTGGGTTWGTDLEVTPGIALNLGTPELTLSVGYAPRFTVPVATGSFEYALLNRATLRMEWRTGPLWTVTALGVFVFGDYSQLNPASTPGGSGPPPPVFNPVRSFQTFPYVGIDTLLRLEGILSPRMRFRLQGGYFDVGGTGEVGEANQPRAWGPQGEVALAWNATRKATLSTTAAFQDWIMTNGESTFITTLTGDWRQAWSSEFETTVGLGGGFANRVVESATSAGKVVPVARASLAYQTVSLEPLRFSLDLVLAPYFDTYVQAPYQRLTITAILDWRPSDAWRAGGSFTAALVPYTVRAPESYGTTGVSASYAPVPFLILTLGGFLQSQFQGPDSLGGTFRQWTGYFSVALRDRFQL